MIGACSVPTAASPRPACLGATWALVLAAAAAVPHPAVAQDVSARAYLTPEAVGLGRQFVLNVEVSGAQRTDADPQLPDMEGFTRYLGVSSSTSMEIVNGVTTVSLTLQYRYLATEMGRFDVGPVGVRAGGRALETEPLSLTVSAAPPPPPSGSSAGARGPAEVPPEDLFVVGGGQPPPGVRERARGRAVPALHPRRRELLRGDADGRQRRVLGRGRPAAPESRRSSRSCATACRTPRPCSGSSVLFPTSPGPKTVGASDGRGEGPNPTPLAQSLRRLLRPRLALRLGRSRRRGVRGGRRGGAAPSRRGPARELHRPRRPAPHVGFARSIRGADERGRDAVAQRLGRGEPPGPPGSRPRSVRRLRGLPSGRLGVDRPGARPRSAGRGCTSTC